MQFLAFQSFDLRRVLHSVVILLFLQITFAHAEGKSTEATVAIDAEASNLETQKNESSARSDPIEIEADAAEQNEAQGTITYRGNVIIKQTDITIHADSVVISSDKSNADSIRQLNRIIATGNPATFDHYVSEDDEAVYAQAASIVFRVKDKSIELSGQAQLNQSQSSVSGENIIYDIEQRRVNAKSSGSDLETGQRVKTVISPDGKLLPNIR